MTSILYGAPLSLYTGKARAYLNWKAVDYREILSTAEIYRDVIVPKVGIPIIPVVEAADGTIVQDTTDIIDYFEALHPVPAIYPAGAAQKLAALMFELYGDEWLLLPAMHYRWAYNEEWAYGEFGKAVAPDAPRERQLAVGRERGARFKQFVPILGINPATIPAIEASYEAFLGEFDQHLAQFPYLFGERPSIGDYGLIGPLYAHLYRDPASGALMKRLAPRVAAWVERVEFPSRPLMGEFLAGDAIPETLMPILCRQAREQLPFLVDLAAALAKWITANPDEAFPPRVIDVIDFTLPGPDGPVVSQKAASPYSLWMFQRALDHLAALTGEDRARAETLLRDAGAGRMIGYQLPFRLKRENYRLKIMH